MDTLYKELTVYNIVMIDHNMKSVFLEYIEKFCEIGDNSEKRLPILIDFEFDVKHEISLIQIGFGMDVLIINPKLLCLNIIDQIIRNIFNNPEFTVVLHGSASLDLPFIYKLFGNQNSVIFESGMIDTHHMMQYIKLAVNHSDDKTSIYHSALFCGAITTQEFDQFSQIDRTINKVKITFNNIKNDHDQLIYVAYDVILLKKIYEYMSCKYQLVLYNNVVSFCLIQQTKYKMFDKLSTLITKYNTQFFFYNCRMITLNDFYKQLFETDRDNRLINAIYQISMNSHMKRMELVFKAFVYDRLLQITRVFINNKHKNNNIASISELDTDEILRFAHERHMIELYFLLDDLKKFINEKIR